MIEVLESWPGLLLVGAVIIVAGLLPGVIVFGTRGSL